MRRRRWVLFVAVFSAFVVAACSGGSGARTGVAPGTGLPAVDESKPPLQPDGPLRGLVMASGIGEDGSVVEPRLGFTTDDKSATAVIGLGADVPNGATLIVAWYRLKGVDAREALFSHKIVIGPGGLAHSQGVAQKGLAPGLYETVATMGKRQVRAPWVVQSAAELQRHGGASAELFSVTGQGTSSLEDWEVPGPGESGWDGDLPPPPERLPPDTCTITGIYPGLEPLTDVDASVFAFGPCTELNLTATVSGPPVPIGSMDPDASFPSVHGQVDVCSLPGGSDMPGTVVRFEVAGSASATEDYALPDLGEVLVTGVESLPEAGSRVQPGDTVKLHALAMLMPSALGIEVLYVDDGTDLIESVGNLSGNDEPVPCDLGRYYARLVTEYHVPADPPPIIEICANAAGFDGTKAKDCIEFYTGEVWRGTYSGSVTYDCGSGREGRGSLDATFTIAVDDEGTATMDIEHTVTGSCAGPDSGTLTTPITATGKRTPAGFEFPTFGALFGGSGSLTIDVTGDRGDGSIVITDLAPGIARVELSVEVTRA